eukprot:m.8811 g.8811  ORF g.8811 m.8811 type:complete len:173 (-) comp9299_c0_seq1:82-600(-)
MANRKDFNPQHLLSQVDAKFDFLSVGVKCFVSDCRLHDFLPAICARCKEVTCSDHASNHNCAKAVIDRTLPTCPDCSKRLQLPASMLPDQVLQRHLASRCRDYIAETPKAAKRKNRCESEGCKRKATLGINCSHCQRKFCAHHRFPEDHACASQRQSKSGMAAARRLVAATA